MFGVRYTGSGYLGSALAMDKEKSKLFFREHGIPTPNGALMAKSGRSKGPEGVGLSFPCVVKPCRGGSSIGVVDGAALPVIEMIPNEGFYDYQNKYKAGNTLEVCPADLPAETAAQMQGYAVAAARALGLTAYSRMDFMLNEAGELYCLEANTLPGMTATSLLPQEAQAAGINFEALCEKLIQISMQKYEG